MSGGAWWDDAWAGIKKGAQVVGNVVRPFVAPIGNAIGATVGLPIAGTIADQGLKLAGLGRHRRRKHHGHLMANHSLVRGRGKADSDSGSDSDSDMEGGNMLSSLLSAPSKVLSGLQTATNVLGDKDAVRKMANAYNAFSSLTGIKDKAGLKNAVSGMLNLPKNGAGRRRRGGGATQPHIDFARDVIERHRQNTGNNNSMPPNNLLVDDLVGQFRGLNKADAKEAIKLAEQQLLEERPHNAPDALLQLARGSAKPKRSNARAEIVKKVMREKGMKMIEASKYVKAHGLY
jgi:hypothetical protein